MERVPLNKTFPPPILTQTVEIYTDKIISIMLSQSSLLFLFLLT